MSTIEITAADAGRSFSLQQGDTFTIRLDENPTTGFQWATTADGGSVFSQVDDCYSCTADDSIGGGGVRKLTYRVDSAGRATLRLVLRQEWEPENADQDFQIVIEAKA